MNYILRDMSQSKAYQTFIKEKNYPINLSGLVCVAKTTLIAKTQKENNEGILVITYNEIEAQRLIKDLSYFDANVIFLPKREISIYDYDVESNDIAYKRIDVINKIHDKKQVIVVTTIESAMQKLIPKRALYENTIKLKSGETVDIENLKETLANIGYSRKPLVENRGEFSVRGGIIDVGTNDTEGIRIELWGDEVDSIRKFKISSQRSTEMVQNVEIYPAKENILTASVDEICKRIKKKDDESKYRKSKFTKRHRGNKTRKLRKQNRQIF